MTRRLEGFRTKKEGGVFPLFSGQTDLTTFISIQSQDADRAKRIQDYKEKQEAKAERYRELAGKHHEESSAARERARAISDRIPMGQPILVGHYSERGHRADLKRIDNAYKKSFEHADTAKYYEKKAELRENPKAISSDDPEAIQKLQSEIDALEKYRHYLKTDYKIIPGAGDFQKGSEHYRRIYLEATARNIRDKKKRIEALKQVQAMPDINTVINGVKVVSDKNENRLKLLFDSIPSSEIRTQLKRAGFHWSPQNKAWQRMISNASIYEAERILGGKLT